MEGSSVRFWFEVMDVDGDGLLTVEDIMTLLHEKADWNHSTKYLPAFEVYWLELCDPMSCGFYYLCEVEGCGEIRKLVHIVFVRSF